MSEPPTGAERPVEIVVDGTDGAGKSTCVRFLVTRLAERGLTAATHAPYREVEVYPLWRSAPEQAAAAIADSLRRFRATHPDVDVVVWDRGWPTAYITTDDERARALFAPLPTVTLLLLNTADRTRQKARTHRLTGEWVTDEALIERYHDAYHRLRAPVGHRMLRFLPDGQGRFDTETLWQRLADVVEPFRR